MSEYLNNNELLKEIHKSKLKWCEFFVDSFGTNYDIILDEKQSIFDDNIIRAAKEQKIKRQETDDNPEDIDVHDLVFRVYTYEHIPPRKKKKNKIKREADKHEPVNFVPFKHYVIKSYDDGTIKEIARSHSKNEQFSKNHAQITESLARMYMMLVERYSQQSNWSNYTYLDEMKNNAILQLLNMGLKFNEKESKYAFTYMSTIIYRSFLNTLQKEKKVAHAKERVNQLEGLDPTFQEQAQHEIDKYHEEHDEENEVKILR